ncbi:hypothetical protein [Endozoicomonas sp.]|uniref:hypothetical protein n=1 Tax=Endozoicomonas sp. TaxID=1892382 RepID=UPI003D9BBF1F
MRILCNQSMKALFILCLCLFCHQSMAGGGWYVTIDNQSSQELLIEFAGNDN